MYTAALLQNHDCNRLRQALEELWQPEKFGYQFLDSRNNPLPHHMTINIGRFNPDFNSPDLLGETIKICVDAFVFCHTLGVCAARVPKAWGKEKTVNTSNAFAHITMCLRFGVKPVVSNQLPWHLQSGSPDDPQAALILETPLIVFGQVLEL